MLEQPPLGHKRPLPGLARRFYCPACRDRRRRLTCRHVLEECTAVRATRMKTGITKFLGDCGIAGIPRAMRYKTYVTGRAPDLARLPIKEHLARGGALMELQHSWLEAAQ